jgi:serine/threonine protein phosphatase PrpC
MPMQPLQSSRMVDMPRLILATRIEEARRGRGEDRIAIVEASNPKLIAVADGAGGVSGGARAAESICRALINDTRDWTTWLAHQDTLLAEEGSGLAAAVVFSISDDGALRGASVGDCEAWMFTRGEVVNLTAGQVRKPLLGDGGAVPASFTAHISGGTLVVATDGLWKYMKHARIAELAAMRPLESAVTALVDGVRLRSGTLQDDVAIVVCEVNGT